MNITGEKVLTSPVTWIAYAIVATAIMAAHPLYGFLIGVAPIALCLLAGKSWARVVTVVVGGMLVLGSSSDVGPGKIIYMSILLFCAAISWYRLNMYPPTWFKLFRHLAPWGVALVICIFIGTLNLADADGKTVLRQSVYYLMVPLAPIIGLDAGRDIKLTAVMRWIGVIGCIAAIGFATDWLDRRGVSSLGFGQFILSSLLLPALAFSLSIVCISYTKGIGRLLWAIPLVIIPSALLITGTRTNLVVFAALIGAWGAKRYWRVTVGRLLAIASLGILGAVVLIPIAGTYFVSQPQFLESRIRALTTVLGGDAETDASFSGRSQQYEFAWQQIQKSPLFGFGPGFTADISLDTPLATVVKLGFVGSIVLIGFLTVAFIAISKSAKVYRYSFMHTAVRGVALVFLASIPFGTPVEDRGFGFMLILLFMGVGAAIAESSRRTEHLIGPSSASAEARADLSAIAVRR